MTPDYVIITPVRNEEKHIEKTIISVISQTRLPIKWVIVNDGSTDNTRSIIEGYVDKYKWIKIVNRIDRGFRKSGGGVIEAFYDGYDQVKNINWDYIVKLDGDLKFEENYFEQCLQKFDVDPALGIGGGTIYNIVEGEVMPEKNPGFHVRGATKIYKREYWEQSGGLIQAPGWDTLDEVKANMLGYNTYSFPEIHIFQLKVTGSADGAWKNGFKNGQGSYIAGYHPLFMALKCIKRAIGSPFSLEAIGLAAGFIAGYIRKTPRIDDKDLINYLRQQQIKRLLLQKSIWK